jgi:hypothetical protein
MNHDLMQRERIRLSLAKGEGRVRVQFDSCEEDRTPHLGPLPLKKGRGGHLAVR